MNAAGQGNFDCYIKGDGSTAASSLTLHKMLDTQLNEQINGVPGQYSVITPSATNGLQIKYDGTTRADSTVYAATDPISLLEGEQLKMTAWGEYSTSPMALYDSSNETYTPLNRYEGSSPSEQTFEYTAVADCKVVCCFRHAKDHTIWKKGLQSEGLVDVVDALEAEVATKIGDAPNDGKTYVRKNASWVEGNDAKVDELYDDVYGTQGEYETITPQITNGYRINYDGGLREESTSSITAPIPLSAGETIKLIATGEYSSSPMSLYDGNTYTPLNRYEGTSPTEQTFEYTATANCQVVCSFRTAQSHTIQVKAQDTEGLIDEVAEKVSDAPVDGKSYARKDAAWVEVTAESITEKKSTNIIPNEWELGFIQETGNESSITTAFRSSVYIPVEAGATITAMQRKDQLYPLSGYYICEYTAAKVFIQRSNPVTTLTLGSTTAFIRITANIGSDISSTYTEYGSRVGFAYGDLRLPWSDYNPQTYLNDDVLIEGVHKHAYPLTWLAMGDSITDGSYSVAGDGSSDGDDGTHTDRSLTWVQKCADITGFKYENIAIGGTGWLKQGSQNDKKNAKQLADETDFTKYDIVTLAYGINDVKSPSPTFAFGDVTDSESANTIAGAMKYVFNKILAANPTCKVVVISPLNCRWGSGNTIANNWALGYTFAGGKTLEDMYQLMKSVCDYCGIQMIDMTHTSIINRYNMVAMTPDTIHPTLEAHERIAWQIANSFDYDN